MVMSLNSTFIGEVFSFLCLKQKGLIATKKNINISIER